MQRDDSLIAHLRAGGFETAVAEDGDAALLLARNLKPRLIIAAADLPGMSVAQFCAALRGILEFPPFHSPCPLSSSGGQDAWPESHSIAGRG